MFNQCRDPPDNEKSQKIIREDIRDIQSTGFHIATLAGDCYRMLNNPPFDPDKLTEKMSEILECGDHLNFIIREKKGRFRTTFYRTTHW